MAETATTEVVTVAVAMALALEPGIAIMTLTSSAATIRTAEAGGTLDSEEETVSRRGLATNRRANGAFCQWQIMTGAGLG